MQFALRIRQVFVLPIVLCSSFCTSPLASAQSNDELTVTLKKPSESYIQEAKKYLTEHQLPSGIETIGQSDHLKEQLGG